MHSANIMHRDIKPANILVDDNCGVKFCDFGLSTYIYQKSDLLYENDETNSAKKLTDSDKIRSL